MNTVLIKSQEEYTDDYPIVMVDVSGSTSGKIVKREFNIISDILKRKDIKECNLICWSTSKSKVYPKVRIEDLAAYGLIRKEHEFGGTDISWAFHILPPEWYEKRPCTEIYIVTDGELCGDSHDFKRQINKLITENLDCKIKIHSIAVENNTRNYEVSNNLQAGDRFYRTLQEQKLMNYVKSFITYNDYHKDEPFISIRKFDVPKGYIPFREQCFSITDTNKFIKCLSNEITLIKDNKEKLDRLTHDLAFTVHNIIADKPNKIRNDIVDMFCKLFAGTENFDTITELLTQEIFNHSAGTSSSYLDYRNNRKSLFNHAQMNLYQDTKKSITYYKHRKYMTVPMKTDNDTYVIYMFDGKKINGDVKIKDKTYIGGGYEVGNYTIPYFPMKTNIKKNDMNQCMRQYIRAILGNTYDISPADDMLLYLFLTMMLKMNLSNVSPEIKRAFIDLGMVMLDRKRYQVNIKEMEHLMSGNPPLPVYGDLGRIISILQRCSDIYNMNIRPYTLWYSIVLALNNPQLIVNQFKYCKKDILLDFPNIEIKNIVKVLPELVRGKSPIKVKEIVLTDTTLDEIEYTCYISLDNTEETGGYKFKSHEITNGIMCSPKYVISPEVIKDINDTQDKNIMCPICHAHYLTSDLEYIQPKSTIEQNMNVQHVPSKFCKNLDASSLVLRTNEVPLKLSEFCGSSEVLQTSEVPTYNFGNMFNNLKHTKIDVSQIIQDKDNKLYNIDKLDFSTLSYQMDNGLVLDHNTSQYMFMNKTNKDFNEVLKRDYNFITKINMNNICIAGGFCRSIMFGKKVFDIDMFLYGLTDEVAYQTRLKTLVKDIAKSLSEEIKNAMFLVMYKQNNSVMELICFEYKGNNPKDHKTFSEVHYHRSKYQIHHKIQIILVMNKDVPSMLASFDMFPCQVVYDKGIVSMTKQAYYAYRYMVNITDSKRHTEIYHNRLKKYYKYGFSIVFPNMKLGDDNVKKISAGHKISWCGDTYTTTTMFTTNNVLTTSDIESMTDRTNVTDYAKDHLKYTDISSTGNIINAVARYIKFINGRLERGNYKKLYKREKKRDGSWGTKFYNFVNKYVYTLEKEDDNDEESDDYDPFDGAEKKKDVDDEKEVTDEIYYKILFPDSVNIKNFENGTVSNIQFVDVIVH